jgi:2-hydroxychromene-2-carboxylate isomerase
MDFYFDFISPYSYLAVKRLPRMPVLAGAHIRWLPVNLPKLIKDAGNTPPATCRPKALYLLQDIKRWASLLEVPLRMIRPGSFDARPALALACTLDDAERIRFCTAAFDALWSGAVDPVREADWLPRIVAVQKLPDEWLQFDLVAGKAKLKQNTETALKDGCFGVPTFILRGAGRPQMFWGVDRMDFLAIALQQGSGDDGPLA